MSIENIESLGADSNNKKKGPTINSEAVNELASSIVPTAIGVPAFIGYTPQVSYEGNSLLFKPMKITSFDEFLTYYGLPEIEKVSQVKQYNPSYTLVECTHERTEKYHVVLNGHTYAILPDPNTIYYLYNSLKLFYENGGGEVYVVSVGEYSTTTSGNYSAEGEQIVNENIKLNDLLKGLEALKVKDEPTLYLCPDAVLLSEENNATLMQEMLVQSGSLGKVISIFDVIGSDHPTDDNLQEVVKTFRENTGVNHLSFGTAYFPFVGTSIMQVDDIDYSNILGGEIERLVTYINPDNNHDINVIVNEIILGGNKANNALHQKLYHLSPAYKMLITQVLKVTNLLPPSGGVAGVINAMDTKAGVWKTPANKTIVGVNSLPIHLTDEQQSTLIYDEVGGKSINAIRYFDGIGILIWGARTLDGNNSALRYIPVKRTLMYIEQSCKKAIKPYAYEPNTTQTWDSMKAMVSDILISIWEEGGIIGPNAEDAFKVQIGVGSSMTAQDVLNGIVKIKIYVAVVHSAEFMVVDIQQQQVTPK